MDFLQNSATNVTPIVKLRSMSIPGPFPVHTKSFYIVLFKYKRPGLGANTIFYLLLPSTNPPVNFSQALNDFKPLL